MHTIDVRNSGNELIVLGGALGLPTSANTVSQPTNGSLRWNTDAEAIEFYNGAWIAVNLGALIYQGVWNASSNSPTIDSGIGTTGYFYKVSVAGSTNIDGNDVWDVGDLIIFNGVVWERVPNTDLMSLSELQDVMISDPVNGQVLTYNSSVDEWQNANPPYDVYGTFLGAPSSNQLIWRIVMARTVVFDAGLPDSVAACVTAASTDVQLTLSKNGSPIGTINFIASSITGSFSFASTVTFNSSDILAINAPNPADVSFSGPSWALIGYRT